MAKYTLELEERITKSHTLVVELGGTIDELDDTMEKIGRKLLQGYYDTDFAIDLLEEEGMEVEEFREDVSEDVEVEFL